MQQSNKKKTDEPRLIRSLVYQVKNHPNKYALIADLLSNRPYYPFSEASKQMIHTLWETWNVSSYGRSLLDCNILIAGSIGQKASFTVLVAHA